MKTRITIFCLLVSAFVVKAQTKTTVAFLPISYDEGIYSSNEARSIQETVINAFVSSNKFTVVDREKIEDLEREKSLQRTEAFLDSEDGFTSGLSKGANYLIDGNIASIRHSDTKGKWVTNVNIQLRMLNVSTGEIMATESVNSDFIEDSPSVKKALKSHYSKDELRTYEAKNLELQSPKEYKQDSFVNALTRLSNNIVRFTSSILPVQADIIDWNTKKNEIVIGAGNAMGVQVGQLADVVKFSVVTVGGKDVQRSEIIGTAWVLRIDDQNFSVASIIDNLKEIKKATKDNEELGVIIR